ncbi:uncharacterized protein LOC116351800 [Contarinia nasturtii]|uniref:uncharacterized protein LOC116351800 n=1 Tax=Contarinia nasturtii TaxID=265458 RepID=UPI0012D3CDCC|nr:uncharacterized protein LOC116351800 [Contarinia nasturtii]XP_031639803.1 uncharacterized protein LOC116351800 [Contarinia nasturtii]
MSEATVLTGTNNIVSGKKCIEIDINDICEQYQSVEQISALLSASMDVWKKDSVRYIHIKTPRNSFTAKLAVIESILIKKFGCKVIDGESHTIFEKILDPISDVVQEGNQVDECSSGNDTETLSSRTISADGSDSKSTIDRYELSTPNNNPSAPQSPITYTDSTASDVADIQHAAVLNFSGRFGCSAQQIQDLNLPNADPDLE